MHQIPIKDTRLHMVFSSECDRALIVTCAWQGENLDPNVLLGWGTKMNLILRNVISSEIIKVTGSNGIKTEVELLNSPQDTY